MNITVPVSWLREYLKTDVAAKTLASYLTLAGPSVERIDKRKEDLLLQVEVTTNRPDAFSMYGLAREANAILNFENQKSTLVAPIGLETKLDPDTKDILRLDVLIRDLSLCPRFTAIILSGVKIKPSPAQIKNRLEACGIRAINNIVDITNYVMLELGQPMHAFDFDKIKGAKMILRQCHQGEKIKTLDGQTRTLPQGAIVIEDSQRLIDLCGIMGAENSQISTRTKRVLIFVQAYDPVKIRKTTQALTFRTDAAARFEKGIDLEGILPALSRAVYLAKKLAGAKVASELIDIYHPPAGGAPKPRPIHLSLQKLHDYLGIDLEPAKAAKILQLLGFTVIQSAQTITATAPSWRGEDMGSQEDLIEEIARINGYHRLPSKLPEGEIKNEKESDLAKVISLKESLKFLGLTEIISYSIISKEFLALTGFKEQNSVELTNPLSQEWQFMRPTILVSLASIVAQNQNLSSDIKLFEIAKTYIRPPRHSERSEESVLPIQDLHLGIILQNSDFYQIKGLVENIFEILGRPFSVILSGAKESLFEPELFAVIISNGKHIGKIGILNQNVANYFKIDGTCAVAEINLTTCYMLPVTSHSYHQIPKFPPVIEDVSAIFDKETLVADIIRQIKKAGSPLIKLVEIIDIYHDQKLGSDKKSVTLRLTYQKPDGTPTQDEVEKIRDAIQIELIKTLKAHIRK